MKRILIIGGLCLLILSVVLFPRTFQEYVLSKTNNFSLVTILKLPNCEGGYKNKFLHIEHEGEKYILRTKCKYLGGLHQGQQILILHKKDSDIFQFKAENVLLDLIAVIFLAAIGLIILIIGFKK